MITFPIATESFIAYQENGISRKLKTFEKDLAAVVVELANVSYQEGMEGRAHTVSMEDVEAFFQEQGKEEAFRKTARIWESICNGPSEAMESGAGGYIPKFGRYSLRLCPDSGGRWADAPRFSHRLACRLL